MNRFLYYDPDRFACVRIPTQIQINIILVSYTTFLAAALARVMSVAGPIPALASVSVLQI